MNNPINNEIFDSRDLIQYKEFLAEEILNNFNEWVEGVNYNGIEQVETVEEAIEMVNDYQDLETKEFSNTYYTEIEHYENIVSFCEELENYGDYEHGAGIIHEDHFTDYTEDLVKDCGYLPEDLPWWINDNINWEGVAEDVKQDYMSAKFEGDTYYIRA